MDAVHPPPRSSLEADPTVQRQIPRASRRAPEREFDPRAAASDARQNVHKARPGSRWMACQPGGPVFRRSVSRTSTSVAADAAPSGNCQRPPPNENAGKQSIDGEFFLGFNAARRGSCSGEKTGASLRLRSHPAIPSLLTIEPRLTGRSRLHVEQGQHPIEQSFHLERLVQEVVGAGGSQVVDLVFLDHARDADDPDVVHRTCRCGPAGRLPCR